jgi:hypothetical protein
MQRRDTRKVTLSYSSNRGADRLARVAEIHPMSRQAERDGESNSLQFWPRLAGMAGPWAQRTHWHLEELAAKAYRATRGMPLI